MSTKAQVTSAWPIGRTVIVVSSEHAGLEPYWKAVETELYKLADRHKSDPGALRDCLRTLAVKIRVL